MPREVVITGLGVVSPIGIGNDAFWAALLAGASGVRPLTLFDTTGMPVSFGAEVVGFDPKEFIKPRKSLKVMSRDIQLGVTAAGFACAQAAIAEGTIDPERFGVVFAADMMQCPLEDVEPAYRGCLVEGKFDFRRWGGQAMEHIYPLWMLKYLPNMPACHIAIAHDARGPNNSHALGEVSSLLAVAEGARVIERGQADVMVVGGASSRIHPTTWVRTCIGQISRRADRPTSASRPFDAERDGAVHGEGAAALILESREHAEARRVPILGRVLGYSSGFEPRYNGTPLAGHAIRGSIANALRAAGVEPGGVGHVNAHGLSTVHDDQVEALAIRDALGDVPVTAPKSYFGNLGAGTGAVELAVSVLALAAHEVPATLNYEKPDPRCPINVIRGKPLRSAPGTALILNQAPTGQAAAVMIAGPQA
ncbi:MAG: beta-ketoacyl-[acyl-carrier-protein] synthase family protein [Planctomycetia bacterium]|nr:beta-ketoacyl-[acyl-carrier-protein] synthase family protein [Planctomycetia bacterium]